MQREFDLILQGATGFTGRLAAQALADFAPPGFRWAIAGRDASRLVTLGEQMRVPFLIADGLDRGAVQALAAQTRVVLSCAGPFARFGSLLVEACVQNQTHYADLTGELPWIRSMIEKHHEVAASEGTVLLPACGFDSVPTDLCVQQFLAYCTQENASPLTISGFWTLRGGINGGTLASGLHLYRHWKSTDFQHPFFLDPDPEESRKTMPRAPQRPATFPIRSLQRWAAPFLMAPVNEKIVRRTAALHGAEGTSFSYREFMTSHNRFQAKGMAKLLQLSETMMSRSWGRTLLKTFGPKPGQGPSEAARARAFARLDLIAGPLDAPSFRKSWHWPGDASNEITVRCLVQAGLALAAAEPERGGVLTPASGLGTVLWNRLLQCGAVVERPTPRA